MSYEISEKLKMVKEILGEHLAGEFKKRET